MSEVSGKITTISDAVAIDTGASGPTRKKAPGLTFKRLFTQAGSPASASVAVAGVKAGISPFDEIQWEVRTAQITDAKGEVIFEQKDVEVPKDWSMTATNIVASKYLHGPLDGKGQERETGVRQLVTRVAETIRDWGIAGGYFRSAEDAAVFHDELGYLLLHQYAAFNSPVWFNVGCDRLEPNSDATNWHWNPQLGRVEFCRHRLQEPAVLGLLHQLRAGHHGVHPDAGQDRGHALQVGIGHGHQPVHRCAAPRSASPEAARPAVRSASCAALTPLPASSRAAARPAAPPRWSSSTSTIPTSRTSSTARPRRSERPGR